MNATIRPDTALSARTSELEALLTRIAADFSPATFASSLSIEDMVLTDLILRKNINIEIFTLDTGRMHADTLAVIDAIGAKYGKAIRSYRPDPAAVRRYVSTQGRDAFYRSVELRKECCEIRKVEPLRRALAGKHAWITGMRRSQTSSRSEVAVEEADAVHGLRKFNPLADWSEEEVWAHIRRHDVPYNQLYEEGYRSIGCAPCTRPVVAGEDARAGRWWWETAAPSECGIHFTPEGKLVRIREEAA